MCKECGFNQTKVIAVLHSTSTKIREFIRTFCKQTMLLILQVKCSIHTPRPGSQAAETPHWSNKTYSRLTPWKGTYIDLHLPQCLLNGKEQKSIAREIAFSGFKVLQVMQKRKLLKAKQPAVSFPQRSYFCLAIALVIYVDVAMAQSSGLIWNTDENYPLITRARCIIIISLSAKDLIENYEYLSGIRILTSSNDFLIQYWRKPTDSFN